jgi:phosphoadenosine phosphosulfate reductase
MKPDSATAAVLLAETQKLSALELLSLVARRFGDRVAFASSFGLEDQVLADLLSKVAPGIAIFTIDTGRLPQETYDVIEATRERYGARIEVLFPDRQEVEQMVLAQGPNLFRQSVESRKFCCHVRKVNVLRRRLADLDAWICGLRREQSITRTELQRIQWDEAGLIKINPLADWTTQQVWEYVRANGVPYNALHDKGYPSIGCAPCTRAVGQGEDIRSGRWWWEQPQHKECGLHVVAGKLVRKA